ncbi:hypothetical protein [cf. Phormidesmis sp. LEGE 11477]|uniref:hypothetical protein n=1 Tax=cf. Phormidesmis sp. LEGE 11477 TaxID=1828680 RepID=UPI0018817DDB|nr:hypothetical protein [cf. Phormidesmis sp. LEGE 11477]MBE9062843.1 hypothetical protein [cf. Phormidesmis sp. LEGE 11477]
MESVKVRQRVGQDGILHLEIPIGLPDQDIEVMVIYQAAPVDTTAVLSLEELYGICADDPIKFDKAGALDERDEDLTGAFD